MQSYIITERNTDYIKELTGQTITLLNYPLHQLNSMQAWVLRDITTGNLYLQSYNTIVGMLDTKTNTFFEFGKYSRTTSKQVTTFCNMYNCDRVLMKWQLTNVSHETLVLSKQLREVKNMKYYSVVLDKGKQADTLRALLKLADIYHEASEYYGDSIHFSIYTCESVKRALDIFIDTIIWQRSNNLKQ